MKRDVLGAPLWICFGALSQGLQPPRTHYAVNYRPEEAMYVIPQGDLVRRSCTRTAAPQPPHRSRTASAPLCCLAAAHASGGGGPHD